MTVVSTVNRSVRAARLARCALLTWSTLVCATAQVFAQGAGSETRKELGGRWFALTIGTDDYRAADEWQRLSSPVLDAGTVASELARNFGFDTVVVRNGTKTQVVRALTSLRQRATGPNDWVFVFVAGHGFFDRGLNTGYLVFRDAESRRKDEDRRSYYSYPELLALLEGFGAGHVLLVVDACQAGTLDPDVATATSRSARFGGATREQIVNALLERSRFTSRTYLTSGGDEYVADGRPGEHSPFATVLLEAVREAAVRGEPLTLDGLRGRFAGTTLRPVPRHGTLRGHRPGGDFLFVPNSLGLEVTAAPSRPAAPPVRENPPPVREEPKPRGEVVRARRAPDNPPRTTTAPPVVSTPRERTPSAPATVNDGVTVTPTNAAEVYASRCGRGVALACDSLGAIYAAGVGVPRDHERAFTHFTRSCELGSDHGCADLALAYAHGSGVKEDAARAVRMLDDACARNGPQQCAALGLLHERGLGVRLDPSRALALYTSACEAGSSLGCTMLGRAHELGLATTINHGSALTYYDRACTAGHMRACAHVGFVYYQGRAGGRDLPRTLFLTQRACDWNDGLGCHILAELYTRGQGVGRDQRLATEYEQRACDGDWGESCLEIARAFHLGRGGVARDLDRAGQLYRRACDLGEQSACQYASRKVGPVWVRVLK